MITIEKPKLHSNWKHIFKKSWAIKWNILSGIFYGIEVIMPLFIDAFPRNVFAALSFTCVCCSTWVRLLVQAKDGL